MSPGRDAGQVHVLASEPHFVDHLAPVWHALPPETRGRFHVGPQARHRCAAYGIQPVVSRYLKTDRGVALVASSGDLRCVNTYSKGTPVVFMEHGCGMTYRRAHNSYAGAGNRQNVVHFLMPNDICADRQRATHPATPVTVIGASPKMDRWAGVAPVPSALPVVAISWHWDCHVEPETRSALYWYRKDLGAVRDALAGTAHLIGHSHPRGEREARAAFGKARIPFAGTFDEVLQRASCYVVDTSSTLYEFAAMDRPVVVMNCPLYRRGIHHGIRFWEHIPGIQVDGPGQLAETVAYAITDPAPLRRARASAVDAVYPQNDGQAATRAATVVLGALASHGARTLRDGAQQWHVDLPGGQSVAFDSWRDADACTRSHSRATLRR